MRRAVPIILIAAGILFLAAVLVGAAGLFWERFRV